MLYSLIDNLDARAIMRCQSTCLEEYILKRDLQLGLSRLDKFLDPIVFIEKYPTFSFLVADPSDKSSASFFMSIFMISWAVIAKTALELVFSGASPQSLMVSLAFNCLGAGCIAMAFFIRILDGVYSMNFAKKILGIPLERKQ